MIFGPSICPFFKDETMDMERSGIRFAEDVEISLELEQEASAHPDATAVRLLTLATRSMEKGNIEYAEMMEERAVQVICRFRLKDVNDLRAEAIAYANLDAEEVGHLQELARAS